MIPHLTFWLICGLGSGVAWMIFCLWRVERQHRQAESILTWLREDALIQAEKMEELTTRLMHHDRQTREMLHALHESNVVVLQHLDQQEAEKAKLWLGSFLPDGESEAALEARLKQSEDRAISATHPVQYSSRPSRNSASGSPREPLIRQARRTGAP